MAHTTESSAAWPPGYHINPRTHSLPAALVEAFRAIPVAVAGDCMGRSIGATGLHGYHGSLDTVLCGPAITVRVRPGDNLMIHAAIALAQPGDILVIDGKGDQTAALMGTLMLSACKKRGLGGVIVDGCIRDKLELLGLDFPVFSAGFNPAGPTKFVPGRVNHPIACGGAMVHPGDLVVGDADGVVVIERAKAPAMLALAVKKVADEAARIESIARGDTAAKWLPAALRAAGVLKEGETL